MITEAERRAMNDRRRPGDPFVRVLTDDGKGYYIGTMYPGESVSEFAPAEYPVWLAVVLVAAFLAAPVAIFFLLAGMP